MTKEKENTTVAIFLAAIAGMSSIAGFSYTLGNVKKKDPDFFSKGSNGTISGAQLALRALGWGTLIAITGTSLFCYGIWKVSGANDFQEFRNKMGNILPKIPKKDPPQSRTEFTGLTDLMNYVATEKFGKPRF